MTFLVRSELVESDGTVLHDETVVAELASLVSIERDFVTSVGRFTFRLTFDPPLTAPAPEDA